ncbi:hypothetical protein BO94DRAFT_549963 [Aspergillus sclerotioniger CBS 115572]|uniref:Uncharacterized protein n=1 Tax=Aspergillus sclerotioniger CBS 115572 TaxID=1450535 RepID=A0A317VJG8_9EURO|nr:hypothetical protein BO94DRAFT_549963 [Aspergillus sclerotioniger CBS 115572]PWY73168.1 hypothetical protein BO94DRAFT_549963 [Aspergillus sclerotioniger CBS 115572]
MPELSDLDLDSPLNLPTSQARCDLVQEQEAIVTLVTRLTRWTRWIMDGHPQPFGFEVKKRKASGTLIIVASSRTSQSSSAIHLSVDNQTPKSARRPERRNETRPEVVQDETQINPQPPTIIDHRPVRGI